MVDKFANMSFFKEKHVIGVFVEIQADESLRCNVIVLEKKKGSIRIVNKLSTSLDKLSEVVSNKLPVLLCVDGKGVLQREFKQLDLTDEQLVLQAFPNVNPTEFYIQQISLASQSTFAAFSRKQAVDEILQSLSTQSFSVLDLHLGSLSINNIAGLMGDTVLNCNNYSYRFKDGETLTIQKSEANDSPFVSIAGESIASEYVLAFATALPYFTSSTYIGLSAEQVSHTRNDFQYRQIMKKGGVALLASLFVVLLVNFMLFTSESEKQKELSSELNQYQETISQLSTYKQELADREKLFGDGFSQGDSHFAFFSDRIAASKPSGIVLNKMHLFPITIKNKKVDINSLRLDTISVEGLTKSSLLLNDWVKKLQKESFVKHVGITNYAQQSSSSGSFSLVIALNQNKD